MICSLRGNFRAGWADTRPRAKVFLVKGPINKKMLSVPGHVPGDLWPASRP